MSDKIHKFLAYEGRISVICADTTNLVEEARKIHEFSPTVTAAFGRMITMTAMLAVDMKNSKDKLTVQINEDGKLDVGGAVGNQGYINVIKDIGLKKPYIGISPLTSGEIAEDFANYLVTSEQKKSAVALGVLVDKNGVKSAGGYIINAMPDATEQDIYNVEQAIFKAGAISKMLDNNLSLEDIAKKITGDENIQLIEENIKPVYKCDCSKEHMKDGIATLGKETIKEIIEEDGQAEIICHFCNKKYNFSKEELEEIIIS